MAGWLHEVMQEEEEEEQHQEEEQWLQNDFWDDFPEDLVGGYDWEEALRRDLLIEAYFGLGIEDVPNPLGPAGQALW